MAVVTKPRTPRDPSAVATVTSHPSARNSSSQKTSAAVLKPSTTCTGRPSESSFRARP